MNSSDGGGWPDPEKYELFFEPEEFSNPFPEVNDNNDSNPLPSDSLE